MYMQQVFHVLVTIAYWSRFDLDHVLDLGDNLYKYLGLNRY